ncbi:glycosyltransferase family A protein [uncultured Draconibacterium sp.]|uniref:glycosyltransferase family 2 protein n=1 Tax=uncultured Draconibacterium sp. TaxID=1573823 RepID=UPI003216CC61
MLSINIPVYNFEIVSLVKQLVLQADALQESYEIRVYDDGSDEIFKSINRNVRNISNVVYVELETNLGRSAIRNKMGLESEFEYLLFIDADSAVVKSDYLQTFISNAKSGRILCGGTAYASARPRDSEKLLRWTYGHKREAVSAKVRNQNKGFIITSNNFLIPKAVFQQVHFRENIKKYGHEDTLLGYDLFKNNFEIFHIQNPVEHTGLESAQLFLSKTKTALKNLKLICDMLPGNENDFINQVNFTRKYKMITRLFPVPLFQWLYARHEAKMERNLKGRHPNLFLFDLYKLSYFSTL